MEITFDDFKKVQIKLGTVLSVSINEKARKPSLVLKVDFGKEIGIKESSAQITHYYTKENLIGKQVIGVCNFPKKKYSWSDFRSFNIRCNRKGWESCFSSSISKSRKWFRYCLNVS